MLDVVIIGAGGFGREIRQLLFDCLDSHQYRFKGFLGKDMGVAEDPTVAKQMLGDPQTYKPAAQDRFVLAIGNMAARRQTTESLLTRGARFIKLIHPSALVADSAQLGQGIILYPFSVVSNEAKLSDFTKLNYYASAGHNAEFGKYCLLAPYATVNGYSVLEDDVYLSTHSTVAPVVRVGARSKVSANSAVMNDVPPDTFVFGVPGRCRPQIRIG